jgi:uncharacterized protein YjlB
MWSDGLRSAMLCANEHFEIEGIESSPSGDAAPIDFVATERPEVLMLLSGEAVLEAAGHRAEHLRAGDTVMLPADRVPTTVDLSPQALLLRATTADPMGSQHDGPRAGERRS